MYYPTLYEIKTSRNTTDVMRGFHNSFHLADGEFYDMRNLSSDSFPILSPRAKRGTVKPPSNYLGLIGKDELCIVDGSNLLVGDAQIDVGLSVVAESCPKKLVSLGSYVIILPDKKYVNTADLSDYGDIEATFTSTSQVNFSMCRADGTSYGNYIANASPPLSADNTSYWLDTSVEPHVLKQYSETAFSWIPITTTYIKIYATGIGKQFEKYDGVTISGVTAHGYESLNNTMVIWEKADDYIVVMGVAETISIQDTPITVKREMPNLDFVVESQNRLWGCRYGTALNGEIVNEIYASKLGDFKNWHCFMGISTDSYAVTVGTDGPFTGAATHLGYPLFFKEDHLHKIYGNYPANYQIQTTACSGVQKGSHDSLAVLNSVLFYKAKTGVCAYDGSLPVEVSEALGEEQYYNAVAGTYNNKYYISMADKDGLYHLFVYDTQRGLWHKEDNTRALAFCTFDGDALYIDADTGKIMSVSGRGTIEEDTIKWSAETGPIGLAMPDKKYLSRMSIRISLNVGTRVFVYAQYDSFGAWEPLFQITGKHLKTVSIPIRPKRCDHFRLRIVGEGDAKIYSITKNFEQGSEE